MDGHLEAPSPTTVEKEDEQKTTSSTLVPLIANNSSAFSKTSACHARTPLPINLAFLSGGEGLNLKTNALEAQSYGHTSSDALRTMRSTDGWRAAQPVRITITHVVFLFFELGVPGSH